VAAPWRWCLVLGGVLLLLSLNTDFLLPAAAWLHGVFLLRHTRATRSWRAVAGLSLLGSLVWLCATATVASARVSGSFAVLAVLLTVPYLLDLRLARHFPGAGMLVFPLARAGAEYVFTLVTGFGNYGSLAETQSGNTALLQVASLTGSYGVSFLVAWPASALNTAWESGWRPEVLRRTLLPCALVLLAVLVAGELRLAAVDLGPTMRVAALHPPRALERMKAAEPVNGDLLERTDREAAAGAKVVVWSEEAGRGEAVLGRVAEVAARRAVQVAAALRGEGPRNQVVLFGADGGVRWRQDKFHPTPFELGEGIRPGGGGIAVSDGLAALICYDLDFPPLVRRAARSASLLLVPAHDWPGLATLHARKAVVRAVESGLPMVRATGAGISLALDPLGRILATGTAPTMIAEVPVRRIGTIYAAIGDVFAWACLAVLAAMAARAALRG
jgi:apolipoprotein N-acyltransferase